MDSQITLLPLVLQTDPANPAPIVSFGKSTPPAGFVEEDLKAVSDLARLMIMNPHILFPPPPVIGPNLRSQQVAKFKDDGNIAFKAGNWDAAIAAYTISCQVAVERPLLESNEYAKDELAISLCNRSAAFIAKGDYVNGLVDAEAVILLRKVWTKGYFRMGKALIGLKRYLEANEAYLLGLQFDPVNVDLTAAQNELQNLIRTTTA